MITLSYGFQLPQTGDKGAPLFNALEANISQLNNHTHDGQNSAFINASAVTSGQNQVLSTNWQSFGGPVGEYRQLVTMAAGFIFDKSTMSFRTADGTYAFPKVQKNSDITFYVYCNDPTVSFNVVYGG